MADPVDIDDLELPELEEFDQSSFNLDDDAEGFPSTVNVLKPQIDSIFSEVQKNLPTIDFDSSDISSDNDEPIFFHQQLKLSELSAFDDDKDLDTSVQGADNYQSGDGNDSVAAKYKISPEASSQVDDATIPSYDNDLAVFMKQHAFPTPDQISSWKALADRLDAEEREQERREEEDIKRSEMLGHFSDIGTSMSPPESNTPRGSEIGVGTDDLNEDSCPDESEAVKKFHESLRAKLLKDMDPKERKKMQTEMSRNKDKEIVSQFAPTEPTKLSLRFFDEVDLDSVLNAANEENIPVTSLRLVGNPTSSQIPQSHAGAGDGKGVKDPAEELTLIQKLAQLSVAQGGITSSKVKAVDPHTGAAILKTDPRLIVNQAEAARDVEAPGMKSTGTVPAITTSCTGTSTDSGVGQSKILYGRVKSDKNKEPPTVFIDLRGFEKKRQDEQLGLQSVQRVLGLGTSQQEEESSSDDSDEEMVERCNWRQTRQKIKEDLATGGAPAAMRSVRPKESARQPKYKKPPRVINLQEHEVSKKWARPVGPPIGGGGDVGEDEESIRNRQKEEEDNRVRLEKLEAEKEKERQREEARKQREAREKEREKRLRMCHQIEAARSQASTHGKQAAGESTPALFDLEASYEPAPTTLPTVLNPTRETLLLTVHLSSNGEIVQHRTRANRSVDTGEGLSATYTALLSWLLSLVPDSFDFLSSNSDTPLPAETGQPDQIPIEKGQNWGFHVLGLQQLWFEESLKLYVVVTPSRTFMADFGKQKHGKGKKDHSKGMSKFAQHMTRLLSINTLYTVCPWLSTLVSVEMNAERQEDKNAPPYSYRPPLPKISVKPLSTFVQVNQDPQAARKIFNIPVGFFWQTVDNDEAWCDIECHDEDINYETQNTMSLIYKRIFHDPFALMAILNRVSQEGLDLSGVRLLYPCPELLKSQNADIPECSAIDLLNKVGPVLSLALRGTFARTIWLDAVGPGDPQLARRTDPNSLCAQFGGESRDNVLLFCPRNPTRAQTELCQWFGGRVPPGALSIDVGVPYMRKEEGRGKKSKKGGGTSENPHASISTHRPPAALTATGKADIFLILSPMLPMSYVGVVMATAQRRGYQIRGVRRVLFTGKTASTLGISSSLLPYFCPGARLDEMAEERHIEAHAPCNVLVLRKENATHNTPSLIEAFMVQLTLAGLLGCVQRRISEPLTSKHLFHAATYSDSLLGLLGGHFHRSPEFDLSHLQLSSSISSKVSKDLEQIAVVIVLGHDQLKKCGMIVSKILNVLPYSKTPVRSVLTDRFELLGLKWTPALTTYQAKELTPYEVGDRRWRQSVRQLAQEPALVLVLRGVDIFNQLKPVVEDQPTGPKGAGRGVQSRFSSANSDKRLDYIMSHNSAQSEGFARLFFHAYELYPDPLARGLLPYLPEVRLYFNVVEQEREGEKLCVFSLKPLDDLDLTQEAIMEEMVTGQQPITTLLLVKPSAVQKYLARVLRKVAQEKFVIVGLRLVMLDATTAEMFVPLSQKKDNAAVQKHQEVMTSGPSLALVLKQQNAIKKLSDLIGPEEPMAARRQSQFLWRGEFGADLINNGLYCSNTYVDAVRDIKTLFPDGLCTKDDSLLEMEEIAAPANDTVIGNVGRTVTLTSQSDLTSDPHSVTMADVHNMLIQTTCLVLTPPLVKMSQRSKEFVGLDLLSTFFNNSFELVGARLVWLTQKQAQDMLYIIGGGSFQQVTFVCEGPCLVLALQRDNAVLAFNSILNQSSESLRLMQEYSDLILRPHTIQQAHNLLAFFFDQLTPGSHVTIVDNSRDEDSTEQ